MKILTVSKYLEDFILGTKKPRDHWKKYRVTKTSKGKWCHLRFQIYIPKFHLIPIKDNHSIKIHWFRKTEY